MHIIPKWMSAILLKVYYTYYPYTSIAFILIISRGNLPLNVDVNLDLWTVTNLNPMCSLKSAAWDCSV